MLNIGIITGSTRSNRVSPQVAKHILSHAQGRADVHYEVIDIRDFDLPLYDEPMPAAFSADYQTPQARAWSEAIARLDGFVFITPEYNRGMTAAQKNAIDYLYQEFANKAAGIVSYGSAGGMSAARALRESLTTLQVATVQAQPSFNLFTDFKDMREFTPSPVHDGGIQNMLGQVEAWSRALKPLRSAT
ncbi:MAG: hypothetical protein RLZ81_1142 [Pseudomonadota bacterium]|jgi:NAD(P)H-dependent FMN reductase